MPETDHERYLSLIQSFYRNAAMSDAELVELTRLHAMNQNRVNQITTEGVAK